ncbi:pilus assembly protein TadG-related protein [Marinobacter sp. C2H3]|uniref:pilus assembly protein TadG-related protein n=1 Tax=Marinobacter sp. C2H3 TaxID=3119003 RepID=UPI00300EBCA8
MARATRRRFTGLQRQRGILILTTPLLLIMVALFATLLIDGARLLMVRSNMQSIANAAATAAADETESCTAGDAAFSAMRDRALAAASAAGFSEGDGTLEVVPGVLERGPEPNGPLAFTGVDPASGMARTNAARVRYTRTEPLFSLIPSSALDPIALGVTATARKDVYAALSATGNTASIEGGLLGQLIDGITGSGGHTVNVTDLDATVITLGDLLDAVGVDSLAGLAEAPLADVLGAASGLVGGPASSAGGLLDDLIGAAGISGLKASAVFDVVGDVPARLDAGVPVSDVVLSTVLNSVKALNNSTGGLLSVSLDTSNSTLLGGLDGALPLLGDVDVSLGLGVREPPKLVFGPARQNSSGEWMTRLRASDLVVQADVDIGLATGEVGDLLSTLTLGILNIAALDRIHVPLAIQAGGGEATLVGARCARGSDNTADFEFAVQPKLASIESGMISGASGTVTPEAIQAQILNLNVTLLNATLLDADVCLNADLAVAVEGDATVGQVQGYNLYCPDGQCQTQPAGINGGALDNLDVALSNVSLQCGSNPAPNALLNALITPVTSTVASVTEPVLSGLVAPLLTALGADLGGVQVTVLGADQSGARLVENVVE